MPNTKKKSHKQLMVHLSEVMTSDSEISNFNTSFKNLTRKYGEAYIFYLHAAWAANFVDNKQILSDDEFVSLNGNMPRGFFEKIVKSKVGNPQEFINKLKMEK